MGDLETPPDEAKLFFLVAREAFRPGALGEPEQRLLNDLRSRLGLSQAEAKQIARQARGRAAKKGFHPGARLDPDRILAHVRQSGLAPALLPALEECLRSYRPPPPSEGSCVMEVSGQLDHESFVGTEATAAPPRPRPPPGAPKDLAPADSGGGDVAHPPAFGAPTSWGALDLLTLPLRFSQRDPHLWGRLVLLQGAVYLVPLVNLLAEPFFAALVAVAAEDEALGRPSGGLRDLVDRSLPRVLPVYLTFGCMLLAFGLAVGLSLGAQFLLLMTLGGWKAALVGGGGTAVLLYQALLLSLYAIQICALGGPSGFAALRESRRMIHRNRRALLGYDAVGAYVLTGGVKVASFLLLKPVMAGISAGFGLLLGGTLGGLLGLPFVLGAAALLLGPARVYRQAVWATLYLRGR